MTAQPSAFCFKCAAPKDTFDASCAACSAKPVSDVELARSLILCPDFQLDSAELPLEQSELDNLLAQIGSGNHDAFDTEQVAIVARYYSKEIKSGRSLFLALLYVLGPFVLCVGWLVYYFFLR